MGAHRRPQGLGVGARAGEGRGFGGQGRRLVHAEIDRPPGEYTVQLGEQHALADAGAAGEEQAPVGAGQRSAADARERVRARDAGGQEALDQGLLVQIAAGRRGRRGGRSLAAQVEAEAPLQVMRQGVDAVAQGAVAGGLLGVGLGPVRLLAPRGVERPGGIAGALHHRHHPVVLPAHALQQGGARAAAPLVALISVVVAGAERHQIEVTRVGGGGVEQQQGAVEVGVAAGVGRGRRPGPRAAGQGRTVEAGIHLCAVQGAGGAVEGRALPDGAHVGDRSGGVRGDADEGQVQAAVGGKEPNQIAQ